MTHQRATVLFGRDTAVAGAVACIERRGIRFLTITGRLGVGRTAVATAVAARLAHDAVLVEVGGAADQHEVVVRLARAVGVTGAGRRIGAALVARLADRPTAIVLDDADDWVAVAPVVDLLLDGCDELVVIATARTAPPATTPESVVHLHPLSVPPPYGSNEKALRETPAVQLFVDRAQRVDPAFDPAPDDLRTIGELCRRLDGLPLAVALAASRISLMQPDAMLREMRRLGSWELVGLSLDDEVARAIADLDGPARRTLAALAVFVGGASIDALHAVTGLASLDETMTALADLVDRDLVAIDRERARYSLASATSAHVCGDGPGADVSLAHRHADHFSTHAREQIEGRDDPDLAIEHGNCLAAVSWLQGAGRHDRALRLLVDMAGDFDRRGEPDAGRLALAAALAGSSGDDPRTEAQAHLWIARFVAESIAPADHRLAIEHQMLARAKAEASGHEPTLLAVLLAICESHTLLGSFDLAADTIAAGLARTGQGSHPVAEVGFLTWKAVVTHQSGDARKAAEIVAEAIAKAVALGDRRLIVRSCLVFLGLPSDVRADVVTESPNPRDLVEMARADGDVRGAGWILALVTGNALDDGDLVQAAAADRGLLAHALERANAPLGRLGLACAVRIAVSTGGEALAARIIGALDRHGAAVEASIAPHSYASYRAAVATVELTLGDGYRPLHDLGWIADWDELIIDADAFLARVVDSTPPAGEVLAALADVLTPRELEVLAELARGQTNKEIASRLGMRPKTVMHHCAAIYRKLCVHGRAGAVGVALRYGFRP